MKNVSGLVRRKGMALAAVVVPVALIGSASAAGETNAGIAAISSAITALAPDMSGVVSASIVIGLIGIGAVAALALGKRLIR